MRETAAFRSRSTAVSISGPIYAISIARAFVQIFREAQLSDGEISFSDRENSFSAKAGPRCPGTQIAVVERRMNDDRYDCVSSEYLDYSEPVNYDNDM